MSKFTKIVKLSLYGVLPLIATFASTSRAQSIDYGSLESMFGEAVTTSANGSPQRSTEVPVDMTIISADDIKHSGAKDLPSLLGRVSGLDVLQWGANSADIGVRGYDQPNSPRLLVLINGRQVYLDNYGYTEWATLPVELSEIRQIEIVKGPNSALFGFNAVSGVINIITYNPKYDKVSNASLSAGGHNYGQAGFVDTFNLWSRLSTRVSFGASRQTEWENTLGLTKSNYQTNPQTTHGSLDSVLSITDKTELRFELSGSNTASTDLRTGYAYMNSKYLTNSAKVTLSSETPFGLIQVSDYQNTLTQNIADLLIGPAPFDNAINVFSIQDLFKLDPKNTFRIGLEERHNSLSTSPVVDGHVLYDVTAISAMWNFAVSETISTTFALRSDDLKLSRTGSFPQGFPYANNSYWNQSIKATSYNAGLVWRVTPKDTIKLIDARGAQVPSILELGGIEIPVPQPGFTLAYMGNPFLKPTMVDNAEFSYDHNFSLVKLGLRIFDQDTKNIVGGPTASELFAAPTRISFPAIAFQNVSNSKMNGIEINASGKWGKGYHWNGDYTTTNISDSALPGHSLVANDVQYGLTTPKNRSNFNIGWQGSHGWSADAYIHNTGTFYSNINTPVMVGFAQVPSYTTYAGQIAYQSLDGLRLSLNGENLFKNNQMETLGLKPPSLIYVQLSKNW